MTLPEFTGIHRHVEKAIKKEAGDGAQFRFGFFTERKQYFDLIKDFDFKPKISKIFRFEDVPEAFESMIEENHFGKIVITMKND